MKKALTLYFFLFSVTLVFSQTNEQIKEITRKYDIEKLKEFEIAFERTFHTELSKATKLANKKGWAISYTDEKGAFYELKTVLNGFPIYYKTFNTAAATSTRADWMHNGGGLGLDVEGQGMTAHVWDNGIGRVTHNEYDGAGGNDRYSAGDGSTTLANHAAHVVGTIIASGFQASAKGMAPQANGIGYDWNNDLSEATAAAANGMLLSNHSYGVPMTNLTGAIWVIGAYMQTSKDWDDLMYNAPYYLMVTAAGNEGADTVTNTSPLEGEEEYDKLTFFNTSKNNMVVANGTDASINVGGTLGSVTRNGSSSEGPTDDLRIKPDIMGNGTGLYSTLSGGNSSYISYTGTSMASPNVCGSLLLLQQHYNNLNGTFMKAATLKGLALHTADDVGSTGPDANTGWGLMNTKVAAETITNNGLQSLVLEEELINGSTFTIDVESDGTNPLLVSISWTDQGGTPNTGILNDGTPVLVNDLDIRVTQATSTFMPWKLTAVNANAQEDNTVDPYERVDVSGALGTYTITVTHKGTLVSGSQNFSLIITGVSSNFTLSTQSSEQVVCSPNDDALYSFNYQQIGAGTTNFTTGPLPTGMNVTISPNSLNADGIFDVTFSNLSNVAANTYDIDIIGNDGAETKTKIVKLKVLYSDFTTYPQSLITPANGVSGTPTSLTLAWAENLNAENYFVEVSTTPSFATIAFSGTETDFSFDVSGLSYETVYYWRVRPDNNCGNGNYSEVYSFQVGSISCGNTFTATDFSDGNIPTTAGVFASAPVTVPTSGLNIESLEVSLEINHTYVNNLRIYLEGPSSLGNPHVFLFYNSCTISIGGSATPGDGDDFNVTYSDSGTALYCDDVAIPSITGTVLPTESLSSFSGLLAEGVWTLRVEDPWNNDGGDITAFSLDICTTITVSSVPNLNNNGFSPGLNTTYTFLTTDIEITSASETAIQQIYTIVELPTIGTLEKNSILMNIGDTYTQEDVDTGIITYTNTEVSTFSDQFKVDIKNGANGWLPNQIITAYAGTLSQNEFIAGSLSIWPNPTNKNLNIRLSDVLVGSGDVNISLFDMLGRKIKNNSYEVNTTIFSKNLELNDVQTGVYLIVIEQGNKKATRRIIKN